jgi:hypothetical protein
MYSRGCLLVSPALIAQPDVFDALADAFNIVRHIEVETELDTHILIVEHPELLELNEGDYLPFYDVIFERKDDELTVKEIGAPYVHTKYVLQCQNQQETPKKENQEDSEPLIWLPE